MTSPCFLNDLGIVCALGGSPAEVAARLFAGSSGVIPSKRVLAGRNLPFGRVTAPLPSLEAWPMPMRSRNNQLALHAAKQLRATVDRLRQQYGPHRVAVVVGTSTSGIGESETAIRHFVASGLLPADYCFAQQELGTLSAFLADALGVTGPCYVHSSACASGAKAMASAARLLRRGVADAVVTGGVDALCGFTVAGFAALNLVSARRSIPLSVHRDGINIGEGAALFVMTRNPSTVRLAGWGESTDGYHFSAPDPSGVGARQAIEAALGRAGVLAPAVDYVNLHATGTTANDLMESAVVYDLFGPAVPTSGTKPLHGHALGGAGALEAAVCWLTMQDDNPRGYLPPHLWDGAADPAVAPLRVVTSGERLGAPPRLALSTSFAFGGANAVLVFGRE